MTGILFGLRRFFLSLGIFYPSTAILALPMAFILIVNLIGIAIVDAAAFLCRRLFSRQPDPC